MHRLVSLAVGTLLFAGLTLAAPQAPKKEAAILCTLTNKKIEKCCCEQRAGRLYCTLAKKTIDKCCCEPGQAPKEKKS